MTPPGREWWREPLTWSSARRFSRVVRAADRVECEAGETTPMRSMMYAIEHGPCWAAFEGRDMTPVGVWGWTEAGAIWSFWRELDDVQVRELLRQTPQYVLEMADQAHPRTLANVVWEDNRAAIAWLKASHCFNLELDRPIILGNKRFIPFHTKPLEDLRRCAIHSR